MDREKELMLKYSFALEVLKTEMNILIKNYEYKNDYNPVEHIKSRIKSKESAIKKLDKKGYDLTFENLEKHVHDMVGIRIVCSFMSDVYEVINLIKNSKQFKILEEKDYINDPKDSGYSSYHLNILVPVHLDNEIEYVEAEIQIRTIAMDFWASLDHKISYKFPSEIPDEVKEEMFNCSLDIRTLDAKMENLSQIMKKYNDN